MTAEADASATKPPDPMRSTAAVDGRLDALLFVLERLGLPARLVMALRSALEAVRRWPLRSLLTVSGVAIGVASILLVAALGEAATRSTARGLSDMGGEMLIILAVPERSGGRLPGDLRLSDADAIARAFPEALFVVPRIQTTATLVAGGRSWTTTIIAAPPAHQRLTRAKRAAGRLLDEGDERRAARVLVLGAEVARRLFPDASALGETLRIAGLPFIVVGVFARRGQSLLGNPDDQVLMPLSTIRRYLRRSGVRPDAVDSIAVRFPQGADLDALARRLGEVLRARKHVRPGMPAPFSIISTAELARSARTIMRSVQLGLVLIAAISLFVGSVGIANIMLVAVTERTREIGLRMALGARRRDIRDQFLVEVLILALGGALMGLAAALLLLPLIRLAASEAAITPIWILAAIGCALVTGLAAGLYPARRAARLQPAEALRFE
ncbi:MAG: multidrug ABC transporter substrate-binding protein [Rhodothalassiaceae bacterium]|nr:MAG: multidrug ABC transporter substrate-binding protein [Rhodothalassiaceae bacterium]